MDLLVNGVCHETRTILLGDIEDNAATRFAAQFRMLLADSLELPIHVILNSQGGSWCDALAIFDVVDTSPVETSVEVMGSCMSAAVPIVQAFDHRVIYPSTTVMVHDGTFSASDVTRSVEAWGKWLKGQRKRMCAILATKSTKTAAWWSRKCCGGDYIMNAHQATELGLFDEVVGG